VTETAALPGAPAPPKGTGRRIAFAILTLALGAGGGWLATQINLPLPWMIGAMVATTIGSLAGLELFMYRWVRGPNVAVLGVMLGSSFTPAVIARFGEWLATIAGLAVYVALVTAILYWYFRRFGHFDRVTAFFAASPGGLNEMTIAGPRARRRRPAHRARARRAHPDGRDDDPDRLHDLPAVQPRRAPAMGGGLLTCRGAGADLAGCALAGAFARAPPRRLRCGPDG
jgi:membrane AbrB-like protein